MIYNNLHFITLLKEFSVTPTVSTTGPTQSAGYIFLCFEFCGTNPNLNKSFAPSQVEVAIQLINFQRCLHMLQQYLVQQVVASPAALSAQDREKTGLKISK
jgi:hypothetical protein